MSGYLSRLVTASRGRMDGASLRPVVRSNSPIAEHDQRIGMAGFDMLSLEDSQGETDAIGTVASESDTSTTPAITPVSSRSIPAVQRKQSAVYSDRPKTLSPTSTTTTQSSSVHKTSHAADTMASSERGEITRPSTATPAAEDVTSPDQLLNAPLSKVGKIPEIKTVQSVLQPTEASQAQTFRARGEEQVMQAIPPGESAASSSITPSLELTPPVEATRLVPSAPDVINHPSRSAEQTRQPISGEHATPQVVIDRLNIEVIQPPVVATRNSATNHKPVSAASASVIGPLGGVRNSNLRFTLRHR